MGSADEFQMKGPVMRYKRNRNDKQKVYSGVINDFQSSSEVSSEVKILMEAIVKEKEPEQHTVDIVDISHRRRSSKMSDYRMRYAYSTSRLMLHDRDCELVKSIPDQDFEMSADYLPDMRKCNWCYRNALIRNSIGADGKRMSAYLHFFSSMNASNQDLYQLLITHDARIKWLDRNTMWFQVNEDSWKIIYNQTGSCLYHNNYKCLPDDSRLFLDGFHQQTVPGKQLFHDMLSVMLGYSWQNHVEKMKSDMLEEQIQKEKIQEETVCAESTTSVDSERVKSVRIINEAEGEETEREEAKEATREDTIELKKIAAEEGNNPGSEEPKNTGLIYKAVSSVNCYLRLLSVKIKCLFRR